MKYILSDKSDRIKCGIKVGLRFNESSKKIKRGKELMGEGCLTNKNSKGACFPSGYMVFIWIDR